MGRPTCCSLAPPHAARHAGTPVAPARPQAPASTRGKRNFRGPPARPPLPHTRPVCFFFFFIDFEQWDLCLSPIKPRGSAFLPLLIHSVPHPPFPSVLVFFKTFLVGVGGEEKKKEKKNFPRPCKLVPEGFQPLPGWSDEKREGERLKRRVDGFFSPRPGRGLQPTHQIHLKCKYELPEQMLQHKTETHVRPGGKRARARRAARGPGRARPLPAGGPRRPGHPPEPASRAPGATPQAPLGPPLCAPHALPRRAACASQASLELQRVSDSLVFSSERLDRSPEDTRWKIVALLTQQPTRDVP